MDNNDFMEYNPSTFSNGFSMLNTYAEDLSKKEYVTNPAIAREEEIKKLMLVLLSPEKSAVLTGKPGIGKTAIVEGLNYLIQRKEVPNALLNTKIYKINTSSLLGTYTNDGVEDSKLQLLINEIMGKKDIILFIDEIHTLVTASKNGDVDFLNTTKKIEKSTGVRWPYTNWVLENVCKFIVGMTSEYKRVYENNSRYPDVSLALLSKCFTYARFENSNIVTFKHIYAAIKNCNSVYPDVVQKELVKFKEEFKEFLEKEKVEL